MSNLNKKLIERELKKLEGTPVFRHIDYAETAQMIIDMDLDDEDFQKYMGRLREIRSRYRDHPGQMYVNGKWVNE